jgi:hypothetical protein
VPGLADNSNGHVSFESVNRPGHYLRHSWYKLHLAVNDGTAQFAADATFRRTTGLADPAASSFASHNYPDHYIRHFDSLLCIATVDSVLARADATFYLAT